MPPLYRVQRRDAGRRFDYPQLRPDISASPVTAPNRSIPTSPSGRNFYSAHESHTAPLGTSPFITSTPPPATSVASSSTAADSGSGDQQSYRSASSSPPGFQRPQARDSQPGSPVCALELGMPEHAFQICPNPDCDCERSPKGSYVNPLYKRRHLSAEVGEPWRERLREDQLRYFLLVSAVNSFTQLVYTKLKDRAGPNGRVVIHIFAPGGKCSTGQNEEQVLMDELQKVKPHLVICPFLTSKVPDVVFNRYLTLVVHPGPPGDVGPSSLDWTLLGDTGEEEDATLAMQRIHDGEIRRRSHWGCVVFQANDDMDKGPVWAWEEYKLPDGPITKGQLYQNFHSPAAWRCIDTAIDEVIWACNAKEKEWTAEIEGSDIDIHPHLWAPHLSPAPHCATHPVTPRPQLDPEFVGFQGGLLRHRPMIAVKDRKLDMSSWSADKIYLFIAAFDSQPGAQLPAPTTNSKTNLFVYGAHVHRGPVPSFIYRGQGWYTFDEIPDGTPLATRQGAVFYKTKRGSDGQVGVWITHGRIIRALGKPLEAKVPLTTALERAGHSKALIRAIEWPLDYTRPREGTWQEVYLHTQIEQGRLFQFVYWDFYNGAFSTQACRLLLEVLEWATAPERGDVRGVILMGGQYFSNGIALNTIEDRASVEAEFGVPEGRRRGAAHETWDNINAIDDIVEFLAGDIHQDRSPFLYGRRTLCERGIVTVAALRGNAAAGGVALAAACDIVMATDNVVLNPAYRAMGLHGSELHSWSYSERCGAVGAAKLLTDMLPMSPYAAREMGLVDERIIRKGPVPRSGTPDLEVEQSVGLRMLGHVECRGAPWAHFSFGMKDIEMARNHRPIDIHLDSVCENKINYFSWIRHDFYLPPLVHYRNEELSQMLLDCFHPTRSKRYHDRRRAFIRKIKCGKTPSRYRWNVAPENRDEEETAAFDDAPGHSRGDEWGWVHALTPKSLKTSLWTQVALYDQAGVIDMLPEDEFGPAGPYRLVRSRIVKAHAHNIEYREAVVRELRAWNKACPPHWRDRYFAFLQVHHVTSPRQYRAPSYRGIPRHTDRSSPPLMQVPLDASPWRRLPHAMGSLNMETPRITVSPQNEGTVLPFSRSASPEPTEQSSEWTALWVPNTSPEAQAMGDSPILYAGPTQPPSIPRQSRRLSQVASTSIFSRWNGIRTEGLGDGGWELGNR